MPRHVYKTWIYDINNVKSVVLLLLQNGRSNQLYFTCERLLYVAPCTDFCFIVFPQPGSCHGMSRWMQAVYTICAVLEEAVKETLFVMARNYVVIFFCYGHLNHFTNGCTKIYRKLESNIF
jgi:hypothetical protein